MAQTFVPRSSPVITAQDYRLAAKLNFYLPHTHGLTLNGGLDTLGASIYEDSSGHVWYRDTISSGGHKWSEVLKAGDVTPVIWGNITGTLGNQTDLQNALNAKLSNITNYLSAGSNVTVTGLGTLASPYVINSSASGTGTVTNFIFTNGNGLTGTVSNSTTTPSLQLGTSLNGIVAGNGTGFSTVTIGSGLNYSGGVLTANGGTSLTGLVSANGSAFVVTNIGAGLSYVGTTLTNTINNTNQLTNGAGFITNATGLISAGTNITITGSGTSGSPYVINASGSGSGTVTTFSSGNLSPLFTTSVTNPNTIPALAFSLSNAAANSVFGNPNGSTGAPSYYVPTLTTLNGWASGSIALLGATQTFTAPNTFNGNVVLGSPVTFSATNTYAIGSNVAAASHVWSRVFNSDAGASLASTTGNSVSLVVGATSGITLLSTGQAQLNNYTTPTSFTGTGIAILEVDASGNVIEAPPTFSLYFVEGISPIGTHGDSAQLGGILGAFFQPDTLYTNGQPFLITGLPSKSTLLSTDSVNITDLSGRQWKAPASAIGGGSQTLQQVFTVQGNRAILTVADTLDATASDLRLIGNIVPSTNASSNLGNGTDNFLAVNAHQFVSNNNMVFGIPTGDSYTWNINSVANMALLSTGQLRLNQYTTTGSFTGTAVGVLEFDASGNILTAAIGTSTITLTGTSGGGQVASAFTFATTTNTANTALTIPGSSNIFTFTYNPAWDMWDNSRTANNNIFGGASVGNTSLSGVRNLGIGGSGSTAITSGSNNIGIGFNSNFVVAGASDDVSIGYASNASDVSGGQNVAVGTFALKNNTAAGNTGLGYEAGESNTSGTLNTYVGWQAGLNNTTGSSNMAIGNQALKNATTTSHSSAGGDLALATLATGLDNTAFGFGAGSSLIDGGMNTHIGSLAGNFQTHNNFNVAVGFKAAALDSAGNSDVEIGSYVASACLNVNYSVILGDSALGSSFPVGFSSHTRSQQFVNLVGAYIGVVSTPSNMAHYDSSAIVGYKIRMAESSTDTLGYNIDWFGGFNDTTSRHDFIGLGNEKNQLLNFSYGGGWSTAYLNAFPQRVGDMAWNTDTVGFVYSDGTNWHKFGTGGGGSGVTTVGPFSASSIANGASISGVTITFGPADGTNPGMIKASGAQTLGATLTVTNDMVIDGMAVGKGTHTVLQNTAVGNLALNAATGANNTAIGYVAGANITTGSSDAFLGSNAGKNTTTGASNIAMGASAFNNNTTGSFDVAIGAGALLTPSAVSNTVAIGYNALNALTNGINNLAIGYTTMQLDTSGANNIAVGNGSFLALLSGSSNFVMGNQSGNTLTTGSGNFLAGYKVDVASGSTSNTLDIAGLILGQGLSTAGGSGYLGGTLGLGTAGTTTAMVTVGIAPYNSSIGTGLVTATATSNDPVTSASGTVTDMAANVIGVPTFSATNTSVTYTNASSLYITGAPAAGTHVTITNPYSLKVAAGPTVLSGLLTVGTVSGSITWNPNGNYFFSVIGANLSDATTAASGTVSQVIDHNITGPTVSATNTGVTYTNAYTVFINGTPAAGTNVTITNPYALGVAGNALFQNSITAASVNLDGSADLTGQTAATTVTSYAVPGSSSSNTFRVGGYITVTAVSLDVIQLQVAWTDETSTSRTQSFFVQGATTGIGTTGANAYSPIDIRVKKGTTITVSTILTTGTGSITYDVGANITQLY